MSTMQNARPAANGTGNEQVGQTRDSVAPAWQRANGTRPAVRSHRPSRPVTVIGSQPWFRTGTPEQRRILVQAVLDARRRVEDRKARVRAHPDLAERLCRSLGYDRFDQWSGFVPPARDADGRLNDSPVRVELLAILRAVAEREAAD